jgi:hypothetical protein
MGIGGAVTVVGGLLPWISIYGFGVSGAQIGGDANVVIAIGVGCVIGAIAFAIDHGRFVAAWIAVLILGIIGFGIMVLNLNNIYRVSQLGVNLLSIVGIGFWAALAGPAVAAVGAWLARGEVTP